MRETPHARIGQKINLKEQRLHTGASVGQQTMIVGNSDVEMQNYKSDTETFLSYSKDSRKLSKMKL